MATWNFRMVDVGDKEPTRRRAAARGSLSMGPRAFRMLRDGKLPKGDALKLGEAAGIMAAKRTPESIPLCHPLALDKIELSFELDGSLPGVHALCEVRARARTGVEMEALSGVSGALLAVYDLVKQVDPALAISDIRLELKEGGKSGLWRHPRSAPQAREAKPRAQPARPLGRAGAVTSRAAVITISDRCFQGVAKDVSGSILWKGLKNLGFKTLKPVIVPDDKERISQAILRLARRSDLIVSTGGTGLSPRDVTPEVVSSLCGRLIPGIGEALRAPGATSNGMSALSRSLAGQLGKTLVIALPGSPGAVQDGLKVLAELLPHAIHIARGGAH